MKRNDDIYKIIRKYYPEGGSIECAKFLSNMSKEQIRKYAHRYGIKCTPATVQNLVQSGLKYGSWISPENDKIIKEYYPEGGAKECMKYIDEVEPNKICSRANRIGVKLNSRGRSVTRRNTYRTTVKKEEPVPEKKSFDKFISMPAPSKELQRPYPYYTGELR